METISISDLVKDNRDKDARILAMQAALDELRKRNRTLSEGISEMGRMHDEMATELEKYKTSTAILLIKRFVTKKDEILSRCRIGEAISDQDCDGEKESLPAPTPEEQASAFLPKADLQGRREGCRSRGSRSERKRREPAHTVDHARSLSDQYPVVDVVVDSRETVERLLERAEKGDGAVRVGEDVIEVLECERTNRFYCKRYILGKFAVRGKPELGVAKVPSPPRLLPKTNCGDSLAAMFIGDKFGRRLAYRTQEAMWDKAGAFISRKLLSDWQLKATDRVMPLYRLIGKRLNEGGVLQMDETPVSIDDCIKAKPFVWIKVVADATHPGCFYLLGPGRSKDVLVEMLEGFSGYLQTDGYSCYLSLEKDGVGVILVPCAAHMRRTMVDATNLFGGRLKSANDIIALFDRLFGIERDCYSSYGTHGSKERFLSERKALALPVIREIRELLKRKPVMDDGTPVECQKYDQAVGYCSPLIDKLPRYLDRFELTPSNNLAERGNIPLKKGLDSWLKFGSDRGCESGCAILTLMRSAELNHLDPDAYLSYVFTHAPAIVEAPGYVEDNLGLWEPLLPWNVKPDDVGPWNPPNSDA